MPIESVKSFKTSDSKTFLNREEAQRHEIELIDGASSKTDDIASWVMAHKDEVLAILQTRKPRAAKTKPATKSKKSEVAA